MNPKVSHKTLSQKLEDHTKRNNFNPFIKLQMLPKSLNRRKVHPTQQNPMQKLQRPHTQKQT
jgi:hypothetical protein